jgi:hypothetical protein
MILRAPPRDFSPAGDILGVTTYGDVVAAITQTDNGVDSLDSDITQNQDKLPAGFFDSWTGWKTKWKAWKADHEGQFAGNFWQSPASIMEERNGWQTELYAWSQQYAAVTKQKPSGPPVQKPPEPGPDLTKTIGESVDSFAQAVRYGAIALFTVAAVAVGVVIWKEVEKAAPSKKAAT